MQSFPSLSRQRKKNWKHFASCRLIPSKFAARTAGRKSQNGITSARLSAIKNPPATSIANLVPSCGKCNQSKGKSYWRTWMEGNARLSPKTRGVPDLAERVARLRSYEAWRQPRKIDFAAVVGPEIWQRHRQNWRSVLELLKKSQELASEIRSIVAKSALTAPDTRSQ
jgi:hypothetical protein